MTHRDRVAPPSITRRTTLAGVSLGALTLALGSRHAAALDATALDMILADAVDAQDAPFLVAMVGDSAGVLWQGAAGGAQRGIAAGPETMFRIFSMTKAVGSMAAMLLIDRGELDMDTPVAEILPAFADLQVLEGFDGNEPILRKPATQATVRQLATHTSGLVYELWNADIPVYLDVAKHPKILSGLRQALNYPLVFDPGQRWDYGIGVDWLGQVVEAVDDRRIDQFCRAELFDPLAMPDTTFELDDSQAARLADLAIRGEDGTFAPFELAPPSQPEIYGMGHALYSTAPDYLRFLRMFLNKGELDGARVLSAQAVDTMLANQIGDLRIEKMISVAPPISADVDLFPEIDKTHSFGFLRNEQEVPGKRAAGSQSWAGVCNTHYWFDPANDIAGVLMTQSLPFVEPRFMTIYDRFERAVYAG